MNLNTVRRLNTQANLVDMAENIKAFAASPRNLFQQPANLDIPPNWHYFILPDIPTLFRLATQYLPFTNPISISYQSRSQQEDILVLVGYFSPTVQPPTQQQILDLATALNSPTDSIDQVIKLFNQHTAV